MAPITIPDITALPRLTTGEQTEVLNLLFEPSPALHALLVPALSTTTYQSYDELIDTAHSILSDLASASQTAPEQRAALHAILGSHPRLGAKKVDSAQSVAEQAKLQGSEAEAAQLAALNAEYEDTFPGLRYVVFVNGRGRPAIMQDMRRRIDRGDMMLEEQAALQAMCDIAKDRAAKLSAAA
ncbi:hypothetical protein VD0004_g7031 [Verticillium dahliae]|uniref:Oxo-4-hydroxy-4-carboxy-5-ureidoimidazoline decarboxylase domain-containing protein n=1 Tax=Verticillium dahliae TaxID=27337 RepID=A0A444S749_VERDA|nr:hypothetical protein VD0004_g7031 [Verticillium dahliae]PNH70125.1 hypothetical protein VD0001_g6987 [Verticillium dahliae]RXG49232.1 hypothetical protein VDGE_09664 [Verticillium dahliae]